MTADVVNLRMARKTKRRSDAAETGATQRAKFGRTRLERETEETSRARAERHLDGHLRETVVVGTVGGNSD